MADDPLKDTRLFHNLNLEERAVLLAQAERRNFAKGELILGNELPNESLFVILTGEVQVQRPSLERDLPVATLYPGSFFGEMSFLDDAPTSAIVVAEAEIEVLVFSKETLMNLLAQRPSLAARIYRNLAVEMRDRLVKTSEMLERYVDLSDVLRANPGAHDLLGYS